MYTVYIIQSEKTGKYYIGFTSNIEDRLSHHNSGANRSTRGKGPWHMVYNEIFEDKTLAWKREQQIKRYKGGKAFKKLLTFKTGRVA
ncbi:MAG: GIY-YIG nuclease family protein [Candidatus Magasanikbacteria bacterium]|nr:GIY-YIG nuclease family protein [Candidatus Magasanikbacteria bacterium]